MPRTVQGRCHSCQIRFEWRYRKKVREDRLLRWAWCPFCADKLRQTTHLFQREHNDTVLPIFSTSQYDARLQLTERRRAGRYTR